MAIPLRPGESRGPAKDKDVQVTISKATFDPDYKRGKATFGSVAAVITFGTADGEDFQWTYKAGSQDYFAVTADHNQLTSARPEERPDDKLQLSPRAEFSLLLNSLLHQGVKEEKIGNNIQNLVGIRGTIRGMVTETYTDDKGQTREVITPLFTKVDPASLAAGATAKTATAGAVASAGTPASENATKWAKTILDTIVSEGSTFKVGDNSKDLKAASLKAFVAAKVPAGDRKAVMETIVNPDFISGLDGYVIEDGTITRV